MAKKKGNDVTTTFKADISDLSKGIQQAKRDIKLANAEFKAASSAMDDWEESTDGVEAKIKQLTTVLDAEKSKLAILEKQQKLVNEEYGESSRQAQEYAIKIANQQAAVNKAAKELKTYESKLNEIKNSADQSGNALDDLTEEIKDTEEAAEKSSDGFTVLKGAVATFAGNMATSLVSSIKDGVSNLMGLAESTREYRGEMNKLSASAKDSGYGADYAMEKYKSLYGVLGDETAANTTVSNFMAIGASQENLDSLLNSSIGIWAKYGDSIPLDGLAESVNETTKVGQVTGNLADALNWAGVNEEQFNNKLAKCSNEQERQQLIVDTLNGLYGDLSKSYQESNKSIIDAQKANADYQEALGKMGGAIEPLTTTMKGGFAEILNSALNMASGMEGSQSGIEQGVQKIVDGLLSTFQKAIPVIGTVGTSIITTLVNSISTQLPSLIPLAVNLLVSLVNGLLSSLPILTDGIMQAVAILLPALGEAIPEVVSKIIEIVPLLVDALLLNIPVLLDGAIQFLMAIVQAIPQLITQLLAALPQIINTLTLFLQNSIPVLLNGAIQLFNALIEAVPQILPPLIEALPQIIKSLIAFFTTAGPQLMQASVDLLFAIIEAIPKIIPTLVSAIPQIVITISQSLIKGIPQVLQATLKIGKTMIDYFFGLPKELIKAGTEIVKGLWKGISDTISWLGNKISGFVDDVLGFFTKGFKIHSPARLIADKVGKFLPPGLAVGIKENLHVVKDAVDEMIDIATPDIDFPKPSPFGGAPRGFGGAGGMNVTFNQYNNSPKALSRKEIYRQTRNQLKTIRT